MLLQPQITITESDAPCLSIWTPNLIHSYQGLKTCLCYSTVCKILTLISEIELCVYWVALSIITLPRSFLNLDFSLSHWLISLSIAWIQRNVRMQSSLLEPSWEVIKNLESRTHIQSLSRSFKRLMANRQQVHLYQRWWRPSVKFQMWMQSQLSLTWVISSLWFLNASRTNHHLKREKWL